MIMCTLIGGDPLLAGFAPNDRETVELRRAAQTLVRAISISKQQSSDNYISTK